MAFNIRFQVQIIAPKIATLSDHLRHADWVAKNVMRQSTETIYGFENPTRKPARYSYLQHLRGAPNHDIRMNQLPPTAIDEQ